MPDKELQGFNINFHTNAAQAAEDVDKLNEAQQRLSKDTEKSDNKSSKRRTRSNKDLRQAVKELKELNKTLKQNREEVEKTEKVEEKADRQQGISFSKGQRRLAVALGAMRTGLNLFDKMMGLVADNAKYAVYPAQIGSRDVSAREISGLHYASLGYGGTAETAAADYATLGNMLSQFKTGVNPLGDLAGRYPGLMDQIMGKGGFYSEHDILRNLADFLPTIKDGNLRKQLINSLGLSDTTFALLDSAGSKSKFDSLFADAVAETASKIADAEKARKANEEYQKAIISLKTDLAPAIVDLATWLKNHPNWFKGIIIANFATEALSALQTLLMAFLLLKGPAPYPITKPTGGVEKEKDKNKDKDNDKNNKPPSPPPPTTVTVPDAKKAIEDAKKGIPKINPAILVLTLAAPLLIRGGVKVPGLGGGGGGMTGIPGLGGGASVPGMGGFGAGKLGPVPTMLYSPRSMEQFNKTLESMKNFYLPPMPIMQLPSGRVPGSDVTNQFEVALTINAPGGDPEQIAAAGTQLVEQVRDVIAAEFRMNDYATATTYNA